MSEVLLHQTTIDGLFRAERLRRGDVRGFFSRFFDASTFMQAGWTEPVVQMNHSMTAVAGTVRGMHFQREPHAERKYVSCLRGAVFDVAVDLRSGSATYGQWFGTELSAANGFSLIIPTGFAHGFQTLEADCELIYVHSSAYAPSAEAGVDALDPSLAITWPLPIATRSDRDVALPRLDQQTGL